MVAVNRSFLIGISWNICCRIGATEKASWKFNVLDVVSLERRWHWCQNASNASEKNKCQTFRHMQQKIGWENSWAKVGIFVWIASFQRASGARQEPRLRRIMSRSSEKMESIMIAAQNAVPWICAFVPNVKHRKLLENSAN